MSGSLSPVRNALGVLLPVSATPTDAIFGTAPGASIYGTGTADALVSLGGGSSLYSGPGDDTYYIYDSADKIFATPGAGVDTVVLYAQDYTLPANVQNLVVESDGANVVGNGLDNIIACGPGQETIDGGSGNDVLISGTGADDFVFGSSSGSDVIMGFKPGIDHVTLRASLPQFTDFNSVLSAMTQAGSDVVLGLGGGKSVTLRNHAISDFTAADFIIPQSTAQASQSPVDLIVGSAPGATIYGNDQPDALVSLGGGSTLYGGTADDTFYIYDRMDKVVVAPNTGIDTVVCYDWQYTLPANVRNLTLPSYGSYGIGNSLDNIIIGEAGGQTIDGGGGNDIITGGPGADFLFERGSGRATITNFDPATDHITLNSTLPQLANFSEIQAAMKQVDSNVVLDLGAGESVTFQNLTIGALSASDFVLPPDLTQLRQTFDSDFTSFSASPNGIDPNSGLPDWRTTYDFYGVPERTLAPGNNEVEYYSDPSVGVNPFVSANGELQITAAPAAPGTVPAGLSYNSGLITTQDSFSQLYGYFEMRAELPSGSGFWPGFWLLRADGVWPPEVDVMEAIGANPNMLYTDVLSSSGGSGGSKISYVDDMATGFHTYGLSWRPDMLRFYFDGREIASVPTPADMNSPMYMVANLAVGGSAGWPGPADGVSSATMTIAYIHAYQYLDLAAAQSVSTAPTVPAVTEKLVADTGLSSSDGLTNNPELTGAGDPNAVVTFREGGTTLGTTTAGATGAWTWTPVLADGAHTVVASETNVAGNTGTASLAFTLDTTRPTVTSVLASPTPGDLGVGNSVTLVANFNAAECVTGAPTLRLNDGGVASYIGGSGTNALTFAYTVAAGQNTAALVVTGISLTSGATIEDGAGNMANLAGDATTLAGPVIIDTKAPFVTEKLAAPTGPSNAGGLTNNPTLIGTGDPNAVVTFTEGGTTLGTTTAGATGAWTWAPVLADGAHTVVASETDRAGNTGTAPLAFTLDTTPPTLTSVLASPAPADLGAGKAVTLIANFSKAVYVTGAPTLRLNDIGVASYIGGSGTNALRFAYTVAAGQNTAALAATGVSLSGGATIKDAAGNTANPAGAVTALAGPVIIDTTHTRTNIAIGTGQTVDAGSGNDIVTLSQGNATCIFHGSHDVAFLGGSARAVNATINDQSSGLMVYVANGDNDVLRGLASDPAVVVDLLGGIGGYADANSVLAALTGDGAGGASLALGGGQSIHFVGVVPASLHGANFMVG